MHELWQRVLGALAVAGMLLLLLGPGPAAAQSVAVDPNTPRLDLTDHVFAFDPQQQPAEAGGPGTQGWFYVDLFNTAAVPQTRIVSFVDPAPGRFALTGGAAEHRLAGVFASTDVAEVPVERVRGFAHAAARLVLPPGERVTVAFEITDPSAEAGVELWTEAGFVRAERAALLRTTLLAGVLVAVVGYLFALAGVRRDPLPGFAGLAAACALGALLALDGVLGQWPLDGIANAESLAAALIALATAFGTAYLRGVLARGLPFPVWQWMARGLIVAGGLCALLAMIAMPGARLGAVGLAVAGLIFAAVSLVLAQRRQVPGAMRLLPAAGFIALALGLGVLHVVLLGGASFALETGSAGALAIGFALLAVGAGPVLRTGEPGETAPAPALGHAMAAPLVELAPLPGDAERYALALAASYQGVWDWDIAADMLLVSENIEQLLGLDPGSLNGTERLWAERVHPEDREVYEHAMQAYRAEGNASFSLEVRVAQADGFYRWLLLRACCIAGNDGVAVRCIGTLSDVSLRKVQEARLVEDALKDGLTGLASRAILLDRLGRLVQDKRRGAPERAALVVFDVDRFRTLNEGLGHGLGDMLLIAIARRLEDMEKPGLGAARIGGDEFAVLIDGPLAEQAEAIAETLRRALREPFHMDGRDVTLTASLGLVPLRIDHATAEDVLRDAEVAMYQAKAVGGDRVERFSHAGQGRATDRLAMEADLRQALARGEMELHFQPVVALRGNQLVGFEALLRWNRGPAGVVPADGFIALAEETGVIVDLGRFAVARAAAELKAWAAHWPAGEIPLFISVNISARELLRPLVAEALVETMQGLDLPPGALKFEITESTMMANPESALEKLSALKAAGAGLALDDFGTGFSSLSYLHRYPFDLIKIDKTFVDALSRKDDARAIVKTIVSLAHDLRLKVVAEGVETKAMADRLLKLRCDYAQGLYFGPALTAEEARARVQADQVADAAGE